MNFLSKLSSSEKSGLTVAIVTLFTYLPMVATMTSYSTVRALIQQKFNMSMTLSGLANSLAFGFTVGFSPISSTLFKKYNYKNLVMLGYAAGAITLVLCGFMSDSTDGDTQSDRFLPVTPQNDIETDYSMNSTLDTSTDANTETSSTSGGYSFVVLYSIIFGICNNFVYNGSISLTGKLLTGSSFLTSSTVILSLAVPCGGFFGNSFSKYLINTFGDETVVKWRFIIFGAACLVSMVVFYFTAVDPTQQIQKTEDEIKCQKTESKAMLESINSGSNSVSSSELNPNAKPESSLNLDLLKDPKVLIWIFSTALWGMLFTIPNTLGTDYMVNNFGLSGSEAADVLSTQAFVELLTRLVMVVIGKKLPKNRGFYALIYSICCFLVGINCIIVSFQDSKFAAWSYFLLLQPPVAIMNCLIFAATENIFGAESVESVWPFTNLLLAIGFTIGPIMCTSIMKFGVDMHQGVLVAGILASVGGGLLALLYTKASKADDRQQS